MFRTRADTSRGLLGGLCARGALALFVAGSSCTTEEPRVTPGHPPLVPPTEPALCESASDCIDFPSHPLTQGPIPKGVESLFAGSPERDWEVCLIEPADKAMLPKNWLPPRFRFEPLPGENLWQITLSAPDVERHELVVYTTRPEWTMDRGMWQSLSTHAAGKTIEVRVRGVDSNGGGPISETKSKFEIAPVEATGTIVYWAADGPFSAGGETKLVGFRIGDSGTVDALQLKDVAAETLNESAKPKLAEGGAAEGKVRCIGCHTSTPAADAVAFVDNWPWNSIVASITEETRGQRPSYVTEAAARILQQPWQGAPTFSKQHWGDAGLFMVQSFGNPSGSGWPDNVPAMNDTGQDRLVWFNLAYGADLDLPDAGGDLSDEVIDLEVKAFGFIERRGDPADGEGTRGAVNPTWSHDGETIAYVSASATLDGHAGGRPADPTQEIETDIYTVPFNGGQGGDAKRLDGASEPGVGEYYPDYSGDDEFIAFTRAESITGPVYYRPDGEIYVIPSGGGTATRLAANQPPECTKQTSPGIINSWPKWSPEQHEWGGKRYYWLIFSSARAYRGQFTLKRDEHSPEKTDSSQLYITAVVVDEKTNEIASYPALYLYNQTTNTTNLTPAWDQFEIPPVEVR